MRQGRGGRERDRRQERALTYQGSSHVVLVSQVEGGALHAQPVESLHTLPVEMHESPHALPMVHTLQHAPPHTSGTGMLVTVAMVGFAVGVMVGLSVLGVGLWVALTATHPPQSVQSQSEQYLGGSSHVSTTP